MASERMEWVEIIEPRTKEHMYANLTTGECVWDPPPGVPVKKTDNNQWWELFDQSTSRFYYYNATSQKTVWHRPTDCDIIPLAKLQTLKQNTEPASASASGIDSLKSSEPKKKETVSTQTQTPTVGRSGRFNHHHHHHRENPSLVHAYPLSMGACKPHSPLAEAQTSPPSPSPSARRYHHHHHHHHQNNNRHHHTGSSSRHVEQQTSQQPPPHLQQPQIPPQPPPPARRHHNHSQDSGRSSDSSVSHSRTSLESGSYRHGSAGAGGNVDSPAHRHHRSPNQAPPPPAPRQPKGGTLESAKSPKFLPGEQPPSPAGISMSTSTPLFKKKNFIDLQKDNNCQRRDVNLDFEKREKNGEYGSIRNSEFRAILEATLKGRAPYPPQHKESSTSPYRESPNPGFRQSQEAGYRSSDKFRPMHDVSGGGGSSRYPRDRVNSLDKSNPAFYSSGRAKQSSVDNTGSIGRRQPSEVKMGVDGKSPDGRGLAVSNVAKQRSFDVVSERNDRDKEIRRAVTCNNSIDTPPQPLARSYSFVQQQKSHQLQQQPHQQKQAKSPQQQLLQQQLQQKLQQKQPSSRRQDRDDDGMHERFLLPDQGRQRFSSVSSSASSNATDSSGSNSADAGDENDDPPPPIEEPSKKKRNGVHPSPPPSPFYGNLMVDADHLLPLQHYILQQAKLSGCYKFGDPLLAEEGDDSLDEEGGRDDDPHGRVDEDSDDQFADDEAASNQGDSSSQEYLDDHYADLANYDTTGIATYYNTADTLTRPHATPPPPPNIVSQAEARESVLSAAMRPHSLPAAPSARAAGGFSLSGIGSSCIDAGGDYDEGRRDDTAGGDIEKYAQDNLNLNCGRPKGLRLLFRKKCSVRDILSWSKDPIPQPMLAIVEGEKLLKREACNLFRLVQVYMGDRKANVGMTLDGVAMEIVNMVFSKAPLRDELYVQICRQTTENPRKESLRRGWELMAICLAFVSPSATFEPYLEGYMNRHRDPNFQFPEVAKWPIHVQVSHYATVACKRLQRIGAHGKRQPRKATVEDIDQARLQIFRASMFGATLSEVMALQRDRFPQRELPWIQTTLTRQVLIRGGTMTEGIFRVSADADEVNVLKSRLDKFEDGAILAASQDAHAPASLLKLWVRELYEPLIPDSFYAECVAMKHDDPEASAKNVAALVERLPELNRKVLCHLIHFLQIFARPDVVSRTKMDASNLAMVMAPNILRCTSHDPRVILENARREMAFVRTMIETLETAWVEDLH
ncbi:rho GTPase-activating protein 39 isoform X1 [Trichogramma pretiosum]|uniref:rho GTPase-activating protein 39 isoform X1 n=1 Tax=Trichogramma pretiosum TaxID=7493 RepID=UPI0006C959A7|nr:rho GTPase-activating protein 39 isoform X1 [Trichogramma pretiosum]